MDVSVPCNSVYVCALVQVGRIESYRKYQNFY